MAEQVKRMKRALQLWLEPEILKALKDQAWASRQSVAEYTRNLIQMHLESIKGPRTITISQPEFRVAPETLAGNRGSTWISPRLNLQKGEATIGKSPKKAKMPEEKK